MEEMVVYYFEEALHVFSRVSSDHFQSGNGTVPGSKTLGVLSTDSSWRSVGATEDDGTVQEACRHVPFFEGNDERRYAHGKMLGVVYLDFAAELIMWSIACSAKLKVMNSMMGTVPAMAAPTPIPAKPASVMGVSHTLVGPYFSRSPFYMKKKVVLKRKTVFFHLFVPFETL